MHQTKKTEFLQKTRTLDLKIPKNKSVIIMNRAGNMKASVSSQRKEENCTGSYSKELGDKNGKQSIL